MVNGLTVDPERLGEYLAEVAKIQANYEALVTQLANADIGARMADLAGDPGHSGPPKEFSEASKTLLGNYQELLTSLHRIHVGVAAQFKHMTETLGHAQKLYTNTEEAHVTMLRGLLSDSFLEGN